MTNVPYKTVGSRDLTGGMSDALSNTFQMISTAEKEKLDKQRLDLQDARQARLDALNTPGSAEWIAAKEAEQQQKMADPMYNLEKAKINQQIAGTPEYAAAKAAELEAYNARLKAANTLKMQDPTYKAQVDALEEARKVRKGQEFLAGVIMGLPTEIVTKTEVTPEQASAARTGLESAAVVNAGNVYNREYAKLTKPDTTLDVDATGEVRMIPTTPAMSSEEAHQEALKRAGLLGVVAGQSPNIDESKLPKVGTTEAKTKLTVDELTQAKIDATIRAVKEGKVPAAVALEVATKLTPVKTQKEKLEEAKLALDIEEFKAKEKGGMYKKSADDKEFSVGEKLYLAAGPSGAEAVKNYLDKNAAKIANLTTAEKKELVALLTAKYGHEEDWLTTTGWDDLK